MNRKYMNVCISHPLVICMDIAIFITDVNVFFLITENSVRKIRNIPVVNKNIHVMDTENVMR